MRSYALLLFGLLLVTYQARSQTLERQVISTGGNEVGDNYSFTIGQAVVGTLSNDQITLSQGYQQTLTNGSVNIIEQNLINDFEVYPNPAKDLLHVEVELRKPINGNIEIRSILGQRVFVIAFKNKSLLSQSINISGLPNGFYILSVINETGHTIATHKTLVQK